MVKLHQEESAPTACTAGLSRYIEGFEVMVELVESPFIFFHSFQRDHSNQIALKIADLDLKWQI